MFESIKLKRSEVPIAIREFSDEILNRKIRKFSVTYEDKIHIGIPWHEADREYWTAFNLNTWERSEEFRASGWCEAGDKIPNASINKIPEGFCVVCVGVYPQRCVIYAGEGAIRFLKN